MTDRDSEHRVLLDQLACKTLHDTYSYAEIVRDADLLAGIFTDDGVWGEARGREAVRAQACAFFELMEPLASLRIAPAGWHVDVDGDAAVGRFFVSSTIKVVTPDGGERIVVCDADYHVEFVRTDDGWRIAVMRGPVGAQLPHDSTLQGEMPSVPIDFGMGEVRREVYN